MCRRSRTNGNNRGRGQEAESERASKFKAQPRWNEYEDAWMELFSHSGRQPTCKSSGSITGEEKSSIGVGVFGVLQHPGTPSSSSPLALHQSHRTIEAA